MYIMRSFIKPSFRAAPQPTWQGSSSSVRLLSRRIANQTPHAPSPSQLLTLPAFSSFRCKSTATLPPNSPQRPPPAIPKSRGEAEHPSYEVTFTCKPCTLRSKHRMSKQAYHKGTVLITCPRCKNRHVISDHLRIFSDQSRTIEDLMREKGELVKKGTIGPDGDVEFWDDGSTTKRTMPEAEAKQQAQDLITDV